MPLACSGCSGLACRPARLCTAGCHRFVARAQQSVNTEVEHDTDPRPWSDPAFWRDGACQPGGEPRVYRDLYQLLSRLCRAAMALVLGVAHRRLRCGPDGGGSALAFGFWEAGRASATLADQRCYHLGGTGRVQHAPILAPAIWASASTLGTTPLRWLQMFQRRHQETQPGWNSGSCATPGIL